MTKLSRLRPAVRWPGGKTCLLRQLLPLLPSHHTYVEPFAGGLPRGIDNKKGGSTYAELIIHHYT